MDNTFNLLKAYIVARGYEIKHIPTASRGIYDFEVIKPRKQSKPRTVEYSEEFEQAWKLYPKRAGSNPKMKAYQQWEQRRLRIGEGYTARIVGQMTDGVKRYAAYCKATDKIDTEMVMQAVRFFGREEEYLNKWVIPKEVTRLKLPKYDHDLDEFAYTHGLTRPAPAGMNYFEYRRLLESEIERRG